jgi:hypothetical protein
MFSMNCTNLFRHVVGLAAYTLGLSGPQSPDALKASLQSIAQQGVINLGVASSSTPNYLAFNGESSAAPSPVNPPISAPSTTPGDSPDDGGDDPDDSKH